MERWNEATLVILRSSVLPVILRSGAKRRMAARKVVSFHRSTVPPFHRSARHVPCSLPLQMILAPRFLPRLASTIGLFTRYGLADFAKQQGLDGLGHEPEPGEDYSGSP